MRIIKPYGRSSTEFGGQEKLTRKLRQSPKYDTSVEIGAFAETHPELVIAQWISAIDKIAAKPKGGRKPTPQQREFRRRLGKAALRLLTEKELFDPSGKDERGGRTFESLWEAKIHPYGKGTDKKSSGPAEGRWYKRFAGDMDPSEADAAAIVERIYEHLHTREYRIHEPSHQKCAGRIAARAASIRDNALRPRPAVDFVDSRWTDKDDYKDKGDVAGDIARKAAELEKTNQRMSVRKAAEVLYDQYGRLFKDGNEKVLSIEEARNKSPRLFGLHMAVKEVYARLLKNHKKKSVAHVLPKDMPALFRLIERKSDNRELNALVRMGKVIHYSAAPKENEDAPRNVIDNWPGDVTHSHYWTSDGQAKIKRNEAFVRVWRHTIALAAQTAKDWADPNGKIQDDILFNIEEVTGSNFDNDAYQRKLPLLFGNRAGLFTRNDEGFRNDSVLRLALEGLAALRNSSFHFKGRGGFVAALKPDLSNAPSAAVAAARGLVESDFKGQWAQLIEALRAAHVESYYDQGRLKAITDAVTDTEPSQSPMPRFRRVLDRAENAWKRKPYILRLPPPGKRDALEQHPGLLCRYVVTKTLYERAFPAWLESRSAKTLNCWIERATDRTTQEARAINKDELAVAKAAKRIYLREEREEEDITHFFDSLSAATATEMRVQRGYDSDADKAREQAKYIDDLRCDVVGQAFEAFLKERSLAWVLDDLTDDLPKNKRSNLDAESQPESASSRQPTKDWHVVLYFLLHLVPVDAVGRLQHQLRKGTILVRKGTIPEGEPSADVEAVQRLFGLYLDMHDAKFEGGEGMAGAEALKELFASERVFSQVCSNQPGEDTDRYVPWRGLREILRFGSLEPLRPIFEQHRITEKDVEELMTTETPENRGGDVSPIAKRQKEREELHAEWVEEKQRFSDRDRTDYCHVLAAVVAHRHLTAHVRLNNHARLNGLLMQVLGRLADYACLWERDLYFTTLALIARKGKSPTDVFQEEGLGNGRIVEAVRALKKSHDDDGKKIFGDLQRLFGHNFHDGKNGTARDRNYLAHFNMLRGPNTRLNLTASVNRTRRLVDYDRKLKNAVSQSIKEMLAREGFDLTWTMNGHRLACAKVKARQAVHLKEKKIRENLHGGQFVKMVAFLFCGEEESSDDDVLSIDIDKIEWGRPQEQNSKRRGKSHRSRGERHARKSRPSRRKS